VGPVRLLSRNLKDLSVSFPEVVRAGQSLPRDSVLDGEIVIADAGGRFDFGALQRRLGAGARDAGSFAEQNPAVLLAFDVPRHEGEDLTSMALRDRRVRLEALVAADPGCLQLISQTSDVEEAEDWLRLLPSIEGVVAKRADGRYLSGQREWVKVKHRRTADCVVIGVAGDRRAPWLVLGLRNSDLRLHHVGLARPSARAGSMPRSRPGVAFGPSPSVRWPSHFLTPRVGSGRPRHSSAGGPTDPQTTAGSSNWPAHATFRASKDSSGTGVASTSRPRC
jgi:hypothetical protein